MSSSLDAETMKRLKFQEEEIGRLQSRWDELDKQRRINKELTARMQTLKAELAEARRVRAARVEHQEDWESEEEEEEEEEEDEGGDEKGGTDQEWSPSLGIGNTPLKNAWVGKSKSFISVAGMLGFFFSGDRRI